MTVHPDPTKTLVFVGDKYGQLGIWDALATPDEPTDEDYLPEGKRWRVQVRFFLLVSLAYHVLILVALCRWWGWIRYTARTRCRA